MTDVPIGEEVCGEGAICVGFCVGWFNIDVTIVGSARRPKKRESMEAMSGGAGSMPTMAERPPAGWDRDGKGRVRVQSEKSPEPSPVQKIS